MYNGMPVIISEYALVNGKQNKICHIPIIKYWINKKWAKKYGFKQIPGAYKAFGTLIIHPEAWEKVRQSL